MSDVKPPRYQVIAPLVVAKSGTPDGLRIQNHYKHAILPQDVPQRQIDMFLRRRLIVEIDESGRPVVAAPADPAVPAAKTSTAKTGTKTG